MDGGGGKYLHIKAYMDMPFKRVSFSQKKIPFLQKFPKFFGVRVNTLKIVKHMGLYFVALIEPSSTHFTESLSRNFT